MISSSMPLEIAMAIRTMFTMAMMIPMIGMIFVVVYCWGVRWIWINPTTHRIKPTIIKGEQQVPTMVRTSPETAAVFVRAPGNAPAGAYDVWLTGGGTTVVRSTSANSG